LGARFAQRRVPEQFWSSPQQIWRKWKRNKHINTLPRA
jgi:hypothetical protein